MRSRLLSWTLGGAVGATAVSAFIAPPDHRHLPSSFAEFGDSLRNRLSRSFSSSNFAASPSSSPSPASSTSKVLAATPIPAQPRDNNKNGVVVVDSPVRKWDDNWDLRDPEFLGLSEYPKATRHLILIRHGQYHLEHDDDADRKLTELGRKQLKLTGDRLKEISCQQNLRYDKIIVSTMTRALESARIVADALPDVPTELPGDALLREGAPYPPEPPNWNVKRSKEQTGKKLQNYFIDGPRIESAFRKYFRRASYDQTEDSFEIIVCHANVIRYFAMRALQLPPEAWLRISLMNGSLTHISISPRGKVWLRALGDSGHMPPDCLTTT